MGWPRASCAGIPLIVWNQELRRPGISTSAARRSPRAPPTRRGTPRSSSRWSDATCASMTDCRRPGHAAALAPNAIWVQMSTIGVAGIERVATLVKAERPDVTLLDAPVSGSKDPAEHGQLTIFASGPDETRSRVTPLFDALGQRTIWVGALGDGSRLKVVNNTAGVQAESVADSVALARQLGLETGRGGFPRRQSAHSPWQTASGTDPLATTSRLNSRWPSRSRTCASRCRPPVRSASPPLLASPTNGSTSSIRDSATRTSLWWRRRSVAGR